MNYATEMNMSNHGTKVNTSTHRACLMEVEDFAESHLAHPESRPVVSCPPVARRAPSGLIGPLLGVLSLMAVAAVAALAVFLP